ncbi:hypothetical protein HK098_005132 [Nowakowskiella sp. JEL0407]|nr:hypothetical protein HK098_005132 [Nowakowskiella sp. JEL0407]
MALSPNTILFTGLNSLPKAQTEVIVIDDDDIAPAPSQSIPDIAVLSPPPLHSSPTLGPKSGKIMLQPRSYQLELIEIAKTRNTIVVMETGTGKTLIALQLMIHYAETCSKLGTKSLSVMIVPLVNLVHQQSQYIRKHSDLRVSQFSGGDLGLNKWTISHWRENVEKCDVIVLTAEIFKNLLHSSYLSMGEITLLVVDECHHARGDSEQMQIFKYHYAAVDVSKRPRVLGLTASPTASLEDPELSIRNLEAALFSVAVVPSTSSITEFVNKTQEEIVYYDRTTSYFKPELQFYLERMRTEENTLVIDKIMQNLQYILMELGSWCAERSLEHRIEEIHAKYLANDEPNPKNKEIVNIVKLLKATYIKSRLSLNTTSERFTISPNLFPNTPVPEDQYLSSKVLTLISILKRFSIENFRGIVFVEQRLAAKSLHSLFTKLPGFESWNTGFMVGHGSDAMRKPGKVSVNTKMSIIQQRETIAKFRKGDIKLLFATSVAEEGLDIQPCNVIIRFDLSNTVTKHIQSRGRARHQESQFIIMAERDNMCHNIRIAKIQEAEILMKIKLEKNKGVMDMEVDGRELPTMNPMPHEIYTVPSTGAIATYQTAITSLFTYLASKLRDASVDLGVEFDFSPVSGTLSNSNLLDGGKNEALMTLGVQIGWLGKLTLPDYVPVKSRRVFAERYETTKMQAKRAAALKAIKFLHEEGELDDNLKSIHRKVKNSDPFFVDEELLEGLDEEEKEVFRGRQLNRKIRELKCSVKIPTAFDGYWKFNDAAAATVTDNSISCDNSDTPIEDYFAKETDEDKNTVWVYTISMEEITTIITNSKDKIPYSIIDPSQEHIKITELPDGTVKTVVTKKLRRLDVGVMTPRQISNLDDLRMTLEVGMESTSERTDQTSFASTTTKRLNIRIHAINDNNCILLTPDALSNIRRFHASAFHLVLRSIFTVDAEWTYFVVPIIKSESEETIDWKMISKVSKIFTKYESLEEDQDLSLDDVNSYIQQEPNESYVLVDRIFYKRTFQVREILNDSTPSTKLDLNNKFDNLRGFYKGRLSCPKKISEHQPLIRACTLPRILQPGDISRSRMEDKNASNAVMIPQFARPWPISHSVIASLLYMPLILQGMQRRLTSIDFRNVTRLHQAPVVLRHLDEALTSPSAGLQFNYERLETLGDAYLKVHLSCHLFATHLHQDEGVLARHRIVLERNMGLVKNQKVNISDYILSERITRKKWRPLFREMVKRKKGNAFLIVVDQDDDVEVVESKEKEVKVVPTQMISENAIADCIEAVIGACVVGGGVKGGAMAIQKLLGEEYEGDWKNTYFRTIMDGVMDGSVYQKDDINSGVHVWDIIDDEGMAVVEKIEGIVGYKFRHPGLVIEALTHGSAANLYRKSSERLEFLGDSVLGFVIMRYLYKRYPNFPPEELTDYRSNLVGNQFLSCVSGQLGFPRLLRYNSKAMQPRIEEFMTCLEKVLDDNKDCEGEVMQKVLKGEKFTMELPTILVEPPKYLADIYEAILGAVFLDSGCDVEAGWAVVKRTVLVHPWIIHPKNIKRKSSSDGLKEEKVEAEIAANRMYQDETFFEKWMEGAIPGLMGRMVPKSESSSEDSTKEPKKDARKTKKMSREELKMARKEELAKVVREEKEELADFEDTVFAAPGSELHDLTALQNSTEDQTEPTDLTNDPDYEPSYNPSSIFTSPPREIIDLSNVPDPIDAMIIDDETEVQETEQIPKKPPPRRIYEEIQLNESERGLFNPEEIKRLASTKLFTTTFVSNNEPTEVNANDDAMEPEEPKPENKKMKSISSFEGVFATSESGDKRFGISGVSAEQKKEFFKQVAVRRKEVVGVLKRSGVTPTDISRGFGSDSNINVGIESLTGKSTESNRFVGNVVGTPTLKTNVNELQNRSDITPEKRVRVKSPDLFDSHLSKEAREEQARLFAAAKSRALQKVRAMSPQLLSDTLAVDGKKRRVDSEMKVAKVKEVEVIVID